MAGSLKLLGQVQICIRPRAQMEFQVLVPSAFLQLTHLPQNMVTTIDNIVLDAIADCDRHVDAWGLTSRYVLAFSSPALATWAVLPRKTATSSSFSITSIHVPVLFFTCTQLSHASQVFLRG